MTARLIVDLGSSRIAWRGASGSGTLLHAGEPGRCITGALAGGEPPDEIVVGSVAVTAVTAEFLSACRAAWGIAPRELVAGREACGVRNAYAEPARLGIDRWAALIAAYHVCGGGVLVADCGTAVTVDYVTDDGRHAGGMIAPGIELMRAALAGGTRIVPARRPVSPPPLFGTDTESAISAGTSVAIEGLLTHAIEQTAARYGKPHALLITGGEAPALLERVKEGWRYVPALVFDGLELLADYAP
jgi:type III pantothenate kinase